MPIEVRPRRPSGVPSYARRLAAVAGIALALAAAVDAGPRGARRQTALDRYVWKPDDAYGYRLVATGGGTGMRSYVLRLTSQTWRSAAEVDRPVWEHWLTIFKPDETRSTTALLVISGGSHNSRQPSGSDPILGAVAAGTGSVVAELRMVPNEPLQFKDESSPRTEDAIIAYSWDKFLRTGDEGWPLRLPMTKSAVRAMDAVTAFCASAEGGGARVDRFVAAGGSKRGWTAWTTAAVDARVVALAPFVIDALNLEKSFGHHYRAYGFWAPAIRDYTDMRIMDWAGTKEYERLLAIEDPYSYRDRLTMPKLIVNATGDQYFLPDSWRYYLEDLKGETHVRYVPNTKHDLGNSDAIQTMLAFYQLILEGKPRPRYAWRSDGPGVLVVEPRDKPADVRLWQATNPKARDFRLDTLGPAFRSTVLEADAHGRYVGRVEKPAEGWTAYFVEMTFPTAGRFPLKLTTGVHVIPDVLPFSLPAASAPRSLK